MEAGKKFTDILIIGGGPAGLTAGLYAVRGGASVQLFEKSLEGGQMLNTQRIENYPGRTDFPDGYTLAVDLKKHARYFGMALNHGEVHSLIRENGQFIAATDEGEVCAKAVILCPGASPKPLSLPGEEDLVGRGLSYCAVCDGGFYKGKTVAVVGGGDTALQDALYLSAIAKEVYLIHRRSTFRGSPVLEKAVRSKENITLCLESRITALQGEKKLSAVTLFSGDICRERTLPVDGLFVAVGIRPNTEMFSSLLELTGEGFIPTDSCCRTAVKGLFAAGDARVTPLRQVITACADGAVAATSALDYINNEEEPTDAAAGR